jgi:hypothetical protein
MDYLKHLRLKFPNADKLGAFGIDSVKADDGDSREVVVIATTSEVDLDSEVVLASGADRSYIDANRSVFADHQYDRDAYCGKIRRIDPVKGPDGEVVGWKVRMFFTRNALGDEMLRQAREDGIGVSIGFQALDWGPPEGDEKAAYPEAVNIIRRWKWLELSVTQLPCNVNARQVTTEPAKSASITFVGDIAVVESAKGVELVM